MATFTAYPEHQCEQSEEIDAYPCSFCQCRGDATECESCTNRACDTCLNSDLWSTNPACCAECKDENSTRPVNPGDVEELLTSRSMEPTLIRWSDTGEVEVVSGVLFDDISYANRNREHQILATATDLRGAGDWDTEHPTPADFEALAEYLNDNA